MLYVWLYDQAIGRYSRKLNITIYLFGKKFISSNKPSREYYYSFEKTVGIIILSLEQVPLMNN